MRKIPKPIKFDWDEWNAEKNLTKHNVKPKESEEVFFDKRGSVQTPVIPFDHKSLSEILKGPAIIESPFTTVLVEPGSSVSRDEIGSLVINIDQ